MVIESDENRLVSDNDECPYCNGIGKLSEPGAPDCPHCKGTGALETFLQGYSKNEATTSRKSRILRTVK